MVTVEERYEHLEKTIRGYNISADFEQIRSAYAYAREHHGAQLRRDGTPYITHPIQVAQIVAEELRLDSESIEAALLHDVMYVFAAFVLFRFPIGDSFIAVALTILGYSINATIVVYDRIRENKRLLGSKVTVDEVVNVSINQSLTRSINTTVSTVIAMGTVCVISVIYHVESILVFSLPMLIGMVAGAYSSVCLAGPLWATWQNYKAAQNKQK